MTEFHKIGGCLGWVLLILCLLAVAGYYLIPTEMM